MEEMSVFFDPEYRQCYTWNPEQYNLSFWDVRFYMTSFSNGLVVRKFVLRKILLGVITVIFGIFCPDGVFWALDLLFLVRRSWLWLPYSFNAAYRQESCLID